MATIRARRSSVSALLALAVALALAPRPALAQDVERAPAALDAAPADGAAEGDADPAVAAEARPDAWHRIRLLGEVGAGLAVLGVGAGVGGLVGLAAAPSCGLVLCLGDPQLSSFGTGAVIGVAAAAALVPLGVAAAGALHGGRGDVGSAYLGLLVGGLAGGALAAGGAALLLEGGREVGLFGVILGGGLVAIGAACVLVGPFLAYELAHGEASRPPDERQAPGPLVLPTLDVEPGGARLGLTGTF